MGSAKVFHISETVKLIDVNPPIRGFDGFIGSYVLCSEKVALVDVGPSSGIPNLLEGLKALDLKPEQVSYIFISHLHIDHAGAAGGLARLMPKATVIVHEKGKSHLIDPEKLWEGSKRTLGELAEKYGPIDPVPEGQVIVAEEGMTFDLGKGTVLEVLITPGHAAHHLSFYERGSKRLFAGEAAGVCVQGAIRPGSPPPFYLDKALVSLDRLIALEPYTLCYGHFGCGADAVANMRLHREQLLLWKSILARCVQEKMNIDQMYEQLRQEDELIKGFEQLSSEQCEVERFFLQNAIRGFLSYFEKQGLPEASV